MHRVIRAVVLPLLLLGLPVWAAPPGVPVCELPRTATPVVEQPFPEEVQRALEALVRAELAREPHAGLAVGVLHGDRRWVGAYGLRDVERGLPATPRTTWRMASITKSFTAVAVMQLVEQGRLTLETDISANVVQITQGTIVLTVVVAYEVVRRYRLRAEQRAIARGVPDRPASREEVRS